MSANVAAVQASWGDAAPAWVVLLAEMCDRTGQRKAADEIKYSPAVVNTVLKNTYSGNLKAVETAVEGAFLNVEVDCPVLEKIKAHKCISVQRRKLVATSTLNIRLWRACRGGCKNYKGTPAS